MQRNLALAFFACCFFVPALAACGGDSDDPASPAVTSGVTDTPTNVPANPGTSPMLDAPASKYAIAVEDLFPIGGWITSLNSTYVLTMENYPSTRAFSSENEGRKILEGWRWKGGYETGYAPEGRDTAVLNGGFYVNQECHIFEDEAGAKEAYAWMVARARSIPGQQPVSMPAIGNESAAFVADFGTIGNSPVTATFHQVIFRRGNVVSIVVTKGSQGFMKVDVARELSLITDQKALGQKPAVEPTPISNYTPPAGN
jgi:hypothetical protein